jgi:nitrogenase molybdenum-cofactor synthesis protein NifE
MSDFIAESRCDCGGGQVRSSPKNGCGKRRPAAPGRGESGCAFRGAKRMLQPIADAAHLVHGPASCETGAWVSRPTASSGSHLHRIGFTTSLNAHDVTFGAEQKLFNAIGQIFAEHDPPAIFVYQTCVPSLIGDDVESVCAAAARKWGRPVIPVDAPGLSGSRPYGVYLAAQSLMTHAIGASEPPHPTDAGINLIGEFNLAGEQAAIRFLLERLGIRVLAAFSGDGRFDDIATAHRARAAVLVCSQGMSHLAEWMREGFGIPFIQGSFYGSRATSDTLRALARLLSENGAPADLPQRTERLIERETRRVAPSLEHYRRLLSGKRALILCGGVKAWSLAATLKDAGMTVVGTSIAGSDEDERRRITEVGPEIPMIDGWEAEALHARLRRGEVDIVLGGGNSQFVTLKAKIPWLEVNHERAFPLTGFDGSLHLLDAIWRSVSNPVWKHVNRRSPWERRPLLSATI